MSDPTMNTNASEDRSMSPARKSDQGFSRYVVLALGLALVIRFFVAAPYVVSGSSMENTFDNWDYLITDRLTYRLDDPQRGDVIVFCLPRSGECSFFKRITSGDWMAPRTLIKRVIGLPGETVRVDQEGVHIINAARPDGFTLDEPYLSPENLGGPTGTNVTLGDDQFFVLGDNRRVSSDSRVWGILPRENIIGHVVVRLFPLSKLDIVPGAAHYNE